MDEVDHYNYIAYVRQFRRLPVMKGSLSENLTYEAHQPPLYYLINALFLYRPALITDEILPVNPCFSSNPEDTQQHNIFLHDQREGLFAQAELLPFQLLRWISILMGAATIVGAYSIGHSVSEGSTQLSALTAAILAFNPQFIYITASVNNDVLAGLLGTTITLIAIIVAKGSKQIWHYTLLGLVVGLALLTKLSLIIFWPLALLASGIAISQTLKSRANHCTGGQCDKATRDYRTTLLRLVPIVVLPVIVAGWWYLRSLNLYSDILGWQVMLEAKGGYIGRNSPFLLLDLLQFIVLHFESYWLSFGWFNVRAPSWAYFALAMSVGVSLAGFASKRRVLQGADTSTWVLISSSVMLTYIALLVYLQDVNWTGYQGRLAFGVIASVALILARGFMSLPIPRIGYLFTVLLFLLAILSIPLMILPTYHYSNHEGLSSLEAQCGRFENGLQVDFIKVAEEVKPGDSFTVSIYGYGLAPVSVPQTISVQLFDENRSEISAASISTTWSLGEKAIIQVEMVVPQSARSGPAQIVVNMLSEEGLNVRSTDIRGRELHPPMSYIFIKAFEDTEG